MNVDWALLRQEWPLRSWRRYTHPKTKELHLTPMRPGDTKYHRYSHDCFCDPTIYADEEGTVVFHHAANGRLGLFEELSERFDRMTDKLIAEYYALQEKLADELYQLEEQIPVLIERRDELRKVFGHDKVAFSEETMKPPAKKARKKAASKSTSPEETLIRFLTRNDGATRPEINHLFHGLIAPEEIGKLIGNMSKRKVIVNKGTRRDSRWSVS